jgi:hypothetical protein
MHETPIRGFPNFQLNTHVLSTTCLVGDRPRSWLGLQNMRVRKRPLTLSKRTFACQEFVKIDVISEGGTSSITIRIGSKENHFAIFGNSLSYCNPLLLLKAHS